MAGVIGFYKDPNDIVDAVKKVRERGYKKIDTFSPYPIHGMDGAMGLGRSWMPWVTFVMGATGAISAFLFQSWTNGAFHEWFNGIPILERGWPFIIGGKPLLSAPAFIPITFEWTVLFGGHSTAIAMILTNKLPDLANPILNSVHAKRVTDDELAVVIFDKDEKYNEQECISLLNQLGAADVQVIKEEE